MFSTEQFRLSKNKFKIKFCKAHVCAMKPIDQAYPECFQIKTTLEAAIKSTLDNFILTSNAIPGRASCRPPKTHLPIKNPLTQLAHFEGRTSIKVPTMEKRQKVYLEYSFFCKLITFSNKQQKNSPAWRAKWIQQGGSGVIRGRFYAEKTVFQLADSIFDIIIKILN